MAPMRNPHTLTCSITGPYRPDCRSCRDSSVSEAPSPLRCSLQVPELIWSCSWTQPRICNRYPQECLVKGGTGGLKGTLQCHTCLYSVSLGGSGTGRWLRT